MDFGPPRGSAPAYLHPCVVVQNNALNRSRVNTTIVCAITSNLARAHVPGNIALRKSEANLLRRSVVNVSQVFTVDKVYLLEKIGTLSRDRVVEILDGISMVLMPTG